MVIMTDKEFEKQMHFKTLVNNLLIQLAIGNFKDENGHSVTLNKAYIDLGAAISAEN